MNNSISGYKDTDPEILLNLSDKDLLAACSSNKYLFNNVCDDNFFYKKLLRSYPDTLKYFTSNTTYKQYYLKVVYYVSKMLEEFNYIYVGGNPETQYQIFRRTLDVFASDDKNYDLLHASIKENEIELVKEAVKRGLNINMNSGWALTLASKLGNLEIVKYLVEQGARINSARNDAVQTASKHGHLEIVKYLVEKGADIHEFDEYALKLASENGHLDVVKYLLEQGADIHADSEHALQAAAKNGHLEVVKYLVNLGANIHVDDNYPLEIALAKGHQDIVDYLNSL